MAREALAGELPLSVVANTVRFELVTNTGAFLSMGAACPGRRATRCSCRDPGPPLRGVRARASLRAALALGAGRPRLRRGGGLANWFDRVLNDGHVTDFVSVGVGSLRTGIFNLADVMIFAGVGLILLASRRADADAEAKAEIAAS